MYVFGSCECTHIFCLLRLNVFFGEWAPFLLLSLSVCLPFIWLRFPFLCFVGFRWQQASVRILTFNLSKSSENRHFYGGYWLSLTFGVCLLLSWVRALSYFNFDGDNSPARRLSQYIQAIQAENIAKIKPHTNWNIAPCEGIQKPKRSRLCVCDREILWGFFLTVEQIFRV